MRERSAQPGSAAEPASLPLTRASRALTAAETSVSQLREAILRRIMRAGCGVGLFALGVAALFVRPFNYRAALIAVAAMTVVFAATWLPRRLAILSLVYPFALVLTGAGLVSSEGPRAEPFLLTCGGLFIGSLVLERRALVLLVLVTVVTGGLLYTASAAPVLENVHARWLNGLMAMLSVVLPAAIAGRMLVTALARALAERTALVHELVEESRVRESTMAALESTRSQLTHAQKMELVGQMAGGIAHDMNNALTAIMGAASLLDERETRDHIQDAAAHAAQLTRQLMVFSRRDTSQARPIDLNATIRHQLRALRRLVTSEIVLDSKLPDEPVPVVADPTQVLQVLLNLTANARDAMENGGTLSLVLRHDRRTHQALLEIGDTGAGIPDDVLPHVFDPFFTTKPAGRGTGLGLASVRQILTGLGGSIAVETQVGRGTRFLITLPTTDAPIAPARERAEPRTPRSGTVLVVDDDVRVRATIYTMLEHLGYRALEASSAEGTQALLAKAHSIDLVLTDVVMAGGGGAQIIELVKERFPRAAVLVMSGYNDDETLRRGIARGAFPFIAKPFTSDGLARALETALGRDSLPPGSPSEPG